MSDLVNHNFLPDLMSLEIEKYKHMLDLSKYAFLTDLINFEIEKYKNTHENNNESNNTVTRAQQNMFRLNKNKNYAKVINEQIACSASIYNKGLYCQRTWFSRMLKIIKTYIIANIDTYIRKLSMEDKKILIRELIFKGDVNNINKILAHGKIWEETATKKLITEVKNKIPNCASINPRFIKIDKIAYEYDLQTVVDFIDKIGINNFSDKYRNLKDFVIMIKGSFKHKIKNQKEKLENGNEKKKSKKVLETTPIQKHIIPASYLDTDVVNIYVKKKFELEATKRINKYNPHEMIGSQVAQQILKKLDDAFKSFFARKKEKSGEKKSAKQQREDKKAKQPKYLKDGQYVLVFQNKSFKIIEDIEDTDDKYKTVKYVRLSLGLKMKEKLNLLDSSTDGFIKFKVPDNIKNEKINEVEITPILDKSAVLITYKYKKSVKTISNKLNENSIRKISFDMGEKNLAVGYSPVLNNPIIYKGGYVEYINNIYKNLIEGKYQSRLKKENNVYKSKHTSVLWRRRNDKLKDYFNKISTDIIKVCIENKITEIIIGYNTNWKSKVHLGKVMNDKFYKIPYRSLIDMIYYKAEDNGIKVIENEESFTSKCDAINLEEVTYHKKYSGKRIKRGLYSSGKHVLVNADVNGAINIMRKVIRGMKIEEKLNKTIIKKYRRICNPIIRKIAI
jgi:putative transposase